MTTSLEILIELTETETDRCVEWPRYRDKDGYGTLKTGNVDFRAHRLSWELANGRPPKDGMLICHHCENPPCINPKHLYEGTRLDNARDAQQNGRVPKAEHGSLGMYSTNGCRCDTCRTTWRRYQRAYRRRKEQEAVAP